MAREERRTTWFHRSGSAGWLVRSLLWTAQCAVVVGPIYVALGPVAGGLVGFVVAAALLFRQIDALVEERV